MWTIPDQVLLLLETVSCSRPPESGRGPRIPETTALADLQAIRCKRSSFTFTATLFRLLDSRLSEKIRGRCRALGADYTAAMLTLSPLLLTNLFTGC